jgi:hypothetical protein
VIFVLITSLFHKAIAMRPTSGCNDVCFFIRYSSLLNSWSSCHLLLSSGIDGHRAVPAQHSHDTAHEPFTRAVPPMGHGHFHRAVPAHGTPCVFNKITYLHTMIQTYQVQSKQQKSKFYETNYYQKELCAMLPH